MFCLASNVSTENAPPIDIWSDKSVAVPPTRLRDVNGNVVLSHPYTFNLAPLVALSVALHPQKP